MSNRVLNVLTAGCVGGIEKLSFDLAKANSKLDFCFVKNEGIFVDKIRQTGNKVFTLYKKGKMHIFKLLMLPHKIYKIYKKERYSSIVFHHGSWQLWFSALVIKILHKKCKVFVYAHSSATFFYDPIPHYQQLIYKKMISKVDGVFAISKFVKDSIVNVLPFSFDKIYVNYDGIECSKYCKENDVVNDQIKIVYVGRLIEEKGVQNIIELLSGYSKQKYLFYIAGDGSYKEQLIEFSKKEGIKENCIFTGMIEDVCSLLKTTDVFVHLPNCDEGFGISVVEAMASGLVCLVNNRGALPEIIQDGINGFVLDEKTDAERFFTILDSVFNRDEMIIQIKNKARETSLKYDILNTANFIYEKCTNEEYQ